MLERIGAGVAVPDVHDLDDIGAPRARISPGRRDRELDDRDAWTPCIGFEHGPLRSGRRIYAGCPDRLDSRYP